MPKMLHLKNVEGASARGAQRIVCKDGDDKHLVFGVVYAPGVPDSHNDFMTAEQIEQMAYKYAKDGDFSAIDVLHDNVTYGCYVVESFIVRKGDLDFPIEGSWVVGVYIPSDVLWSMVKKGDLNGFSMEVLAYRNTSELEIEAPGYAWGRTDKAEDHDHEFEVYYDEGGQLIGGRTNEWVAEDGTTHIHVIKRGTATEVTGSHSHRFAFIDRIVGVTGG